MTESTHTLTVNGIRGKPSLADSWTDRRARHIQLHTDHKAEAVENAIWVIRTRRRQRHYARQLAKIIRAYNAAGIRPHVEAHSNGTVLVLMALSTDPALRIDRFTMLFPAAWASFRENGLNAYLTDDQVGKVIFVGSKNDKVVKWGGGLTRWLRIIGPWGYGTLSSTGPRDVDPAHQSRLRIIWKNHWGHNTFAQPRHLIPFLESLIKDT